MRPGNPSMRNPGLREYLPDRRVPTSLAGATEHERKTMRTTALTLIVVATTLAALALFDGRYDGRIVLAVVFLIVAVIIGAVIAHREGEIL